MDAFTNTLAEHARSPELTRLRREAAERFLARGLPTVSEEAWKYTSLATVAGTPFVPAGDADRDALDASVLDGLAFAAGLPLRIIVVNGGLRRDLSALDALPAGITLSAHNGADALADAVGAVPESAGGFTDLNTAFLRDGIVIDVEEGTVHPEPVHLVFVGTRTTLPLLRLPRVVVRAAPNSSIHVVEEYIGTPGDAGFTNALTDVRLAEGATVHHHRLQMESDEASHVGRIVVHAAAGSTYNSDSVAFGAQLSRVDIDVALAAREARCRLNGLFVAGGTQHIDHHTCVDHIAPDTHSDELYRGVLDDRGRGVFNGKVIVRPDAQRITAQQKSNNLLLSRHAEIDTKPELEIYADDVSCAHGATVGELDLDAMFYLRSRGIPESDARALLIYAFAESVIEDIPVPGIREWIERRFLGGGGYGELAEALGQS